MGGQQSVRGYRQDQLLADNGLFASAEICTPILKIPKLQTTIQLSNYLPFSILGQFGITLILKLKLSKKLYHPLD
ncbi:MAG: hypothetical protein WCO29_09305 [Nostocales cyanobacterium ELA583]